MQSGSGCPVCANHAQSERMRIKWLSGAMDSVFQSPTSIEIETAGALDAMSLRHQSQYRPEGYGRIFDEFIPPAILIECHGTYWHGPERPENQGRDKEKAQWARANGYTLVILWEHEIKEWGAKKLIEERVLPLIQ